MCSKKRASSSNLRDCDIKIPGQLSVHHESPNISRDSHTKLPVLSVSKAQKKKLCMQQQVRKILERHQSNNFNGIKWYHSNSSVKLWRVAVRTRRTHCALQMAHYKYQLTLLKHVGYKWPDAILECRNRDS